MPRRSQDKSQADDVARRMAEALRKLRLHHAKTQAELAEQIGISLEAYSRIERGQSLPSYPTLMRLCELLGVTPDALLAGDVPTGTPTSRPRVRHAAVAEPAEAKTADPDLAPDKAPRRPKNYPMMRNPEPQDEADDPPGAAPEGRVRLGAREKAKFDWMVQVLERLDRADRGAVRDLVRHLAVKAGVLPPEPEGLPEWGTPVLSVGARVRRDPMKVVAKRRLRGQGLEGGAE